MLCFAYASERLQLQSSCVGGTSQWAVSMSVASPALFTLAFLALMQGGAAERAPVLRPGADGGHGGVLERLPNWRRRHVAHVWRGWPGRRHGQAPGAGQPPALEPRQELGRQRCHAPGWVALLSTNMSVRVMPASWTRSLYRSEAVGSRKPQNCRNHCHLPCSSCCNMSPYPTVS